MERPSSPGQGQNILELGPESYRKQESIGGGPGWVFVPAKTVRTSFTVHDSVGLLVPLWASCYQGSEELFLKCLLPFGAQGKRSVSVSPQLNFQLAGIVERETISSPCGLSHATFADGEGAVPEGKSLSGMTWDLLP